VKLVIFGLDGLYPAFLDAFSDEFPNLGRLAHEGVRGALLSTIPPYTPQAWAAIATGADPGTHGISGFTVPEGGKEVLADRRAIRVKRLEEYLTERGLRVGLLNVPLTFPAPALEGFAVSGMLTPDVETPGFTRPESLARELLAAVPRYRIDCAVTKREVGDDSVWKELEGLLSARIEAVSFLLRRMPVDVFFVVFVVLDRIFHLAFRYLDREDPLYETRKAREARARLRPLFRRLDGAAGELAQRADTFLVVSDHGFRREEGKFYTNRFLAREGFLRLRSSPARKAVELAADLFGTRLPRKLLPRKVFTRSLEKTTKLVKPGARAFASSLVAQGIWTPDEGAREEIAARLRALEDPRDGSPLLSGLWRREEIYHGPYAGRFPDLVLELKEGGIEASPHLIGRSFLRFAAPGWPGGHHDRRGTFLLWGRGAARRKPEEIRTVEDVTPFVLKLLEG